MLFVSPAREGDVEVRTMNHPRTLDGPVWIAVAVGVLPVIAGHAAYLISACDGLVPWCVPYWDGCVSISRAARHGLANLVFKAVMLPVAGLLLVFWWLAHGWLGALGRGRMSRHAMLVLGAVGAVFLVLYAAFLGVEGSVYQWLRRYGITVYFAFTVLSQMLLVRLLQQERRVPAVLRRTLLLMCAAMLLLGLASVPLQHVAADRDAAVNRIEWCYALLMTTVFPLVGLAWHRSGVRLAWQPWPHAMLGQPTDDREGAER